MLSYDFKKLVKDSKQNRWIQPYKDEGSKLLAKQSSAEIRELLQFIMFHEPEYYYYTEAPKNSIFGTGFTDSLYFTFEGSELHVIIAESNEGHEEYEGNAFTNQVILENESVTLTLQKVTKTMMQKELSRIYKLSNPLISLATFFEACEQPQPISPFNSKVYSLVDYRVRDHKSISPTQFNMLSRYAKKYLPYSSRPIKGGKRLLFELGSHVYEIFLPDTKPIGYSDQPYAVLYSREKSGLWWNRTICELHEESVRLDLGSKLLIKYSEAS